MHSRNRFIHAASIALVIIFVTSLFAPATAQDPGPTSPYLTTTTLITADGQSLTEYQINGPAKPPAGYELQRQPVDLPESNPAMGAKSLTVPAYDWVFGCSSVTGSMIAAYYDRNGYPNMYTGPTNGGVMPMDNSIWGHWTDSSSTTYPNIPLAASHQGVDGRTTRGSIDDYWVSYGSSANDPYITGGWTQHSWGTAIGDYMKTSQSAYSNTDGSTSFWTYTSSAARLTCDDIIGNGITNDGTVGRRQFYQARGYSVSDCYNQKTDNNGGGFTFAMYKAEIDAGNPVMLNLAGHTIAGVGYNDTGNTVYINDTWDYTTHAMTWGGSYSGMSLLSVSIVHLAGAPGRKVYVPHVIKQGIPFTGKVTDNGRALAGVPLTLWYSTNNGDDYGKYSTATSASDGTFKFTDTPPLLNDSQMFVVEFYNYPNVSSRLFYFDCNTVTTSNADYTCNLNLHDIVLSSPANSAYVNPASVTFSWVKRSTNTDSYWLMFYDTQAYDIYWQPNLGYVSSRTTALPTGLPAGMYYQWWMDVATPEGFGQSNYYRWLGLSSPSSPTPGGSAFSVGKPDQLTAPVSAILRQSGKFLPPLEDGQ